jgi:hypothetical protein
VTTVVRQISTRRQIAKDATAVVRAAREARMSLASLVRLVARTRREVDTVTDQGLATTGWIRSSERDRLEDFYMAMSWLQQAENQMAQLRGQLSRAIERAERRLG